MQIPPPDVDPHKMSLINLPIFKPVGQSNDMDERGYLLDSCGCSKKIKHGWRRFQLQKKTWPKRDILFHWTRIGGGGCCEIVIVGITRSKVIFLPCDLEMRFAPQRCPIFRHLNFKGGPNLCTRRFSAPTFPPSRPTNHWKNTMFGDFPTISRAPVFSFF